jgi:rod shape-determining protein MreC
VRPLSQPGKNRRRSRYVLLVLTLLAVTLITLDARGVPILSSAKDGSRDVTAPVRDAARWVSTPFRNAWNGISGYDELQRENERLRDELAQLDTNAMRESSAQEELALLKAQLNLSAAEKYPTQIARVSSGPFSNFSDHTVELDKGSDHGLQVGNPVITAGGLIGKLVDVSRTRSVVQLITDPDFVVGVTVTPSQARGVGSGNGTSDSFVVEVGDLQAKIEPNDPVFAGSIEDSIMPPDSYITIGTVDKVSIDEGSRSQVLQLNLDDRFASLYVVQVIKWVPPN